MFDAIVMTKSVQSDIRTPGKVLKTTSVVQEQITLSDVAFVLSLPFFNSTFFFLVYLKFSRSYNDCFFVVMIAAPGRAGCVSPLL